jgi:hypothetical protein
VNSDLIWFKKKRSHLKMTPSHSDTKSELIIVLIYILFRDEIGSVFQVRAVI